MSALAGVLVWCSASAAQTPVSAGDASSTQAYLRLQLAETRGSIKDVPRAIAAVETLGTRLQTECPGVLANAPKPTRDAPPAGTELQIAAEETDATLGTAEHTEYVRAGRFARAVAKLHWSNRALTHLAHIAAAEEAAKEAIVPPDLCADVSAWVSSGYQTVSTDTPSYLRREAAVSKHEGSQATIMRQLARYENASDRRTARQIADLEKSALPPLVTELLAALDKVSEVLHATSTPAATQASAR